MKTALMSTTVIHRPRFLQFINHGVTNYHTFPKISASSTMTMDSRFSRIEKKEELSVELVRPLAPRVPQWKPLRPSNLHFDRLQPSDQECIQQSSTQFGMEFGQFVAREAVLDEEYWTAAWLRAESHWENQTSGRYTNNFKIKFAEQEFNALKRRCKGQYGQKCFCIIMVRKAEKNVKRIVIKSVVGTLDLSIRYFTSGETFPGERVNAPPFCSINRTEENRYGYITNVCVSQAARRRGIGSIMLHYGIELAKLSGLEEVFVHVHRSNIAAQKLYQKMGFMMVDIATAHLSDDQTYLLCFKM